MYTITLYHSHKMHILTDGLLVFKNLNNIASGSTLAVLQMMQTLDTVTSTKLEGFSNPHDQLITCTSCWLQSGRLWWLKGRGGGGEGHRHATCNPF